MGGAEAGRPAGRQRGVARSEARLIELLPAPWRRAGAPRRSPSPGKAGTQRQGLRLAAGRADHPVAGDQAMIVAGVGCRRGTSADEIEKRRAPGARHVRAAGRTAATRSRPNRRRRPSPPSPEVARRLSVELDGLHGRRSRPGRGPGADAVQAGARSQGRAVDRRGLGAGRRRPQCAGCSARASRPSARPAPSPRETGR